jgi:hypothetical protein
MSVKAIQVIVEEVSDRNVKIDIPESTARKVNRLIESSGTMYDDENEDLLNLSIALDHEGLES